jgi:hypothetical protein
MARHFEQLKRMREKVERLKAKEQMAKNPRIAAKHLRQADIILTSIQAVKENWKEFGESARGNTNFRGRRHSREAREQMSDVRKDFWKSKAGFEKMWRARRRRQYREEGKCLIRFPRLPSSVDKKWLSMHRKTYKMVIGQLPDVFLY